MYSICMDVMVMDGCKLGMHATPRPLSKFLSISPIPSI